VGAATEVEMKEKKARIENALHAPHKNRNWGDAKA
jgi:chaperonin GroEL (HSP60 family)